MEKTCSKSVVGDCASVIGFAAGDREFKGQN